MTTDLVKRLESGETGREIDAEVFRHLGYTVKMIAPFAGSAGGRFLAYPPNGPERCEPARLAVSTSLDAAVALVERVRPGWGYRVYSSGDGTFECRMASADRLRQVSSTGASECGVRLAALLKAKGAGDV